MMKYEFEELAGYEVSAEDYKKYIEPMYIAADVDKEEFVKMMNKKRFALKPISKIVKEMRTVARCWKDTRGHYEDLEVQAKFYELCNEYMERKNLDGFCNYMVGHKYTGGGCPYPVKVSIYSKNTLEDYEIIDLKA